MKALPARGLLLDAGALRDAERRPRGRTWAMCAAEVAEGRQPLLPLTVLAQMWRGGPGQAGLARVARVAKVCTLVGIDERLARRIGVLLGRAGTADVVDAMVVLVAAEAGTAVVTSDPGDLSKLSEAAGVRVPLIVL